MKGKHYKESEHNLLKVFLIIIAILSICSVVFAKYISETYRKTLAEADRFILACNYTDGNIYNIYDNYFTITLSNYELDNVNEADIEYSISIKDAEGNDITYTDSAAGIINGSEKNTTEIKATNLEQGKAYIVEINTIKPYKRSINMQFYVVDALTTDNYYSITSNEGWVQLDVYIGANVPSEGITINYSGLQPDNTNEIMRDWTSTGGEDKGIINNLNANSHYTLFFFGECNNVTKTMIIDNLIKLK